MISAFSCIGRALWEPLGVVFGIALGVLVLRIIFGSARRNVWNWLLLLGTAYAFLWRRYFNVHGDRYHNVFIFLGLFAIIGFWEKLPLPRRWKQLLMAGLLLVCIGRDLTFNPRDREIRDLYARVEVDSRQFSRKIGFAYDTSATRDQYCTKLPVFRMDRPAPLPHLLKNLKDNLAVYDGDFDAVYLFAEAKRNEFPLLKDFQTLAPAAQLTKLGECYLDRHCKKRIAIWRYQPSPQPKFSGGGELIFNGDFSQLAPERDKQGVINGLGKRMVRFQTEEFELPVGWCFYQSWMAKTKAFATRVKKGDRYALRLEANGYLAAIPKAISVKKETILSFHVQAEKDSILQITRAGQGIGMIPVVLLPLKAGTERRYEIKLAPYVNSPKAEIWFWLDHGTIELSDVRIK